jgi:hypothetical protein
MEINLQGGVRLPQSLPGARPSGEVPVVKSSDNSEGALPVPAVDSVDLSKAEARRFEQVQRAAQSFFKDVYAVNDHTFSIYKDSAGQYITRFTSLRDGKVTYIPEPKLLERAARESVIEIQA